jgi:hypothetical protein
MGLNIMHDQISDRCVALYLQIDMEASDISLSVETATVNLSPFSEARSLAIACMAQPKWARYGSPGRRYWEGGCLLCCVASLAVFA